jgi:hypothetical protein
VRDPRPVLAAGATALALLLVWSLLVSPPSALLVSTLTTFLVAVFAAYVAVHTFEFLNRTNQVRQWRRDDAHTLLKPVYDDLLKIVPIVTRLESPNFRQFRPDFEQAEGSWQDWGLGDSTLTMFTEAMENYEELEGKALGAAYNRFGAELEKALGPTPDPKALVDGLYQPLQQWGGRTSFWFFPDVDPNAAMRFAAAYSEGATKRGTETSVKEAHELLDRIFKEAIPSEPHVKVFLAAGAKMLASAETLKDDVRDAIRRASGVETTTGAGRLTR